MNAIESAYGSPFAAPTSPSGHTRDHGSRNWSRQLTALQLVVLIGATILVGARLARLIRAPSALVVLALGALTSFVPGWTPPSLPPDAVLLLFLPALLYWESLTTSLREIRSNLRTIILLSIGLVAATAAVVAMAAHALGLTWPMAWVLGCVVAPTDATAVSAVAVALPRRLRTTLRAESLINDGTALVLYGVALDVALGGESPSIPVIAGRFVFSYAGGVMIGIAAAVLAIFLRRWVRGSSGPRDGETVRLENVVSLLTPFLAYLPAEQFGASGVVSVVTCGLVLSQLGPSRIGAAARRQATDFWQLTTYVLNAALFALIGLQLHSLIDATSTDRLGEGLRDGVLVALLVTGTRLAWGATVPYLIRAIDRRPAQRARRVGWRQRVVTGWGGFRGAVSLAAALAIPTTMSDGTALPDRDIVLLITFVVIAGILLVQAPTMPAVVRWARFPVDEDETRELQAAERTITEVAMHSLDAHARDARADPRTVQKIRKEYAARLELFGAASEDGTQPADQRGDDGREATAATIKAREVDLRTVLIAEKRAALIRLRDERTIDDIVLRRIQSRLDQEEIRLSGIDDD